MADTLTMPAPKAGRLRETVRRIGTNPSLALGLGGAALVLGVAVLGPLLWRQDPLLLSADTFSPPSLAHPMGTDDIGRDMLARVIAGARVSLTIGVLSALIAAMTGTVIGAVAGYAGGRWDGALMRVTELFQVVPRFLLAIVVVALFGNGQLNVVLVIGLLSWVGTARIVRAQFQILRNEEFVLAAEMSGARPVRVILRHILPNVLPYLAVSVFLQMGAAILVESFLSFIGLGNPERPSWGLLLQQAQLFLQSAWWLTAFPGAALFVTIFALNLLGDSLSSATGRGGTRN